MGLPEKIAATALALATIIIVWLISGAGLVEKITATVMAAIVIACLWWLCIYKKK